MYWNKYLYSGLLGLASLGFSNGAELARAITLQDLTAHKRLVDNFWKVAINPDTATIVRRMNAAAEAAFAVDPYDYNSRISQFVPTIMQFAAFSDYVDDLRRQKGCASIEIGTYLGANSRALALAGVPAKKIHSTNLKAGLRDISFRAFSESRLQDGRGRLEGKNFYEPVSLSPNDRIIQAREGKFTHAFMGSVLHTIPKEHQWWAVHSVISLLKPDRGVGRVLAVEPFSLLEPHERDASYDPSKFNHDEYESLWNSFEGSTVGKYTVTDVSVEVDENSPQGFTNPYTMMSYYVIDITLE